MERFVDDLRAVYECAPGELVSALLDCLPNLPSQGT
jgi:hypothetical protein